MFKECKYTKWYLDIIENSRYVSGYGESHHIIPRSLGGSNKKENLVKLTPREHFICHWLLTKMVESVNHKKKMIHALNLMMRGDLRYKPNSHTYESLRTKFSNNMKGSNNPMFGKSYVMTDEMKASLSRSLKDSTALKSWTSSDKFKQGMSKVHSKPIQIISIETNEVLFEFENSIIGSKALGCTRANLTNAARDNRPIGRRMKSLGQLCLVKFCQP